MWAIAVAVVGVSAIVTLAPSWWSPAAPEATASGAVPPPGSSQPRYVFYFIGDGMGPVQVQLAEQVRSRLSAQRWGEVPDLSDFPVQATVTTGAIGARVTDSAAAGTALATGRKTAVGVLGLAEDRRSPLRSVAFVAQDQGRRVGILSSVSLDHATPAAFYARHPNRNDYVGIASQAPVSGFDLFAGGGFLGANAGAQDALATQFRRAGYRWVRGSVSRPRLPAVVSNARLDDESAMPYELDRQPSAPRLADYTRQAIEWLDSPAGFLLVVEGGKIDWGCHANDATTVVLETLELMAAVGEAVRFLQRHPDETLIIVTADHETGGLEMNELAAGAGELIASRRSSFRRFQALAQEELVAHSDAGIGALRELVVQHWALDLASPADPAPGRWDTATNRVPPRTLTLVEGAAISDALAVSKRRIADHQRAGTLPAALREHDEFTWALARAFDRRLGVHWGTRQHTAAAVPVFVDGVGRQRFSSIHDNTHVARGLLELLAGPEPATAEEPPLD